MQDESRQIKVTFEPTGRSVFVLPGTRVIETAARAGLPIDAPCGGAGQCGKCRVRFAEGAPSPSSACREHFDETELRGGWRLACQVGIEREAAVSIPETSLFADRLQILTDSERIADLAAAGPGDGGSPLELRADEPNFAVAFDVGTTTLVGELLELPGGEEKQIAAGINPQVSFGDDVVSRIGRARKGKAEADELRDAVRGALGDLVDELCEAAGVSRAHIRGVSFSGNTTMQHLLSGLDVSTLAELPFEPARYEALDGSAAELGIALADGAEAYVMPVIGGFVGGDTVSGILTTGLAEADAPTLMIDIGTNGELVLASGGKVWASSTAAGPAFEGARISCGMRAAAGAIEKVVFDHDLKYSVIGGVRPIGICGSALVDVVSELLRCGIVASTGQMLSAEELAGRCEGNCEELRRRVRRNSRDEREFLLAEGDGEGPEVAITQKDIRELQLATGALRAGVGILLAQAGLDASDLGAVLIAGGFGSFIRRANAQRIGLIPEAVPSERIRYVGNVSLQGAKWTLISAAARAEAQRLAREVTHVELSNDPQFQMAFAEAMIFPGE